MSQPPEQWQQGGPPPQWPGGMPHMPGMQQVPGAGAIWPEQQVGMLQYAVPVAPRKPASVMVLSIIGIVLSSLALLAGLWGFVMFFIITRVIGGMTGASQASMWSVLMTWQLITTISLLILAILLLTVSIAAIRMARWGRMGMVWYALLHLAWVVVRAVLVVVWLIPEQEKQYAAMGVTPGMMPWWATWGGELVSIAGHAAFPVVVLIFFTRPKVKQAFEMAM